MTSRIGIDLTKRSRLNNGGFTLIEVMIAVTVLAVGLVMIQSGFLRSASLLSRVSRTLEAQQWIDEKMWDVKERLFYTEDASPGQGSGNFEASGKEYGWTVETRPLSLQDIYSIRIRASWQDGSGPVEISREIYGNSGKKS